MRRCGGAAVRRCGGHYRASDSCSSQPGRLKPELPKPSFLERKLLISDPLKRKRLKLHLLSFRSLNVTPLKLSPLALTAALAAFCAGLFAVAGAAITEFQDNSGGSQGAAGGVLGSTPAGMLIAALKAQKKTHMAVDLRITDVQTAEITGATAVKGTARDVKSGALLGTLVPGAAGLGTLQFWENTPRAAAPGD